MKTLYSEYKYSKLARLIVKGKINRSREEIIWRVTDGSPNASVTDIQLSVDLTVAEILSLEGKSTHLFCNKILFDWLVFHAKDIELNKTWVNDLFQKGEKPNSYIPIILHVSGGTSPCCIYMKSDSSQVIVVSNDAIYYVGDKISDDAVEIVLKENSKEWSNIFACSMFIKGLSIYMNCCDGVLRDGVPDDLKHAPRFNEKCSRYIRTHPDIFESNTRSVSPHFRNGHFRLLVSDQFTKKKGQVVFVHECFVKGQAKTVIEKETKE